MEMINDPTLTFRKRKGTTNKGSEYENLVIANLVISLLSDPTVKDFKISSNDSNFGIFDDIVLDIESTNGSIEKYAIQVKHSNDRILTKASLTEKNGNFSLTKYLTEYRKLSRDDVKFCLYTNRNFDISDKVTDDGRTVKFDKTVKIDNFELTIEEIHNGTFSAGRCFKFLSNPSDRFFDNFRLLTNQVDIGDIKKNIEGYFRQYGCHDYCHKRYLDFVTEWCNLEGKKIKLCQSLMRREICLILSSESIHQLTIDDGHVTPEMLLLRKLTMSKTMSFSENVKDVVTNLWRDCTSELTDFEKVSTLTRLYQTKDVHVLLWLMGLCPLLVTRTPATDAAMNLCPDMNFVILDKSEKLSYSKLSSQILTTFRCTLQGKDITLDHLIGGGGLIQHLTTDDLVKMTISEFPLGEAETLPFAHIDRFVTKHIFALTILDAIDFGLNGKDFVVITNFQNCQSVKHKILNSDDFLSVEEHNWEFCNGKVIFVTRNEYTVEEFDKICSLNSGKRHYHQFRLASNGLEWVRSRGGIQHLSHFQTTHYVSESKMSNCQTDNRINIVCASPGMGKTTLMKSLKNNTSAHLWTVMIYARSCCGSLTESTSFVKYVLSEIDTSIREIVAILIDERRVRFIWDGLDEVSDHSLTSILTLIEKFDSDGIVQWITSRDNLKVTLERRFGVLSRTIKEFDEDEQMIYIEKSLGCRRDSLRDIFGKIKTNIQLFPNNDILGIPLQIYLLTELLRNDRQKYQDLLDKNLFSVADLYQHFVDEKFNIYCQEKENIKDRNDLFAERNRRFKNDTIDLYERMAIKNFDIVFDNSVKISPIVKDPIGVIVGVKYGTTIEFIHTSFVEYFAASFLTKNRHLVVEICEFLSNERYNNVRFFFDLLLSKSCRAHIAVLYKNVRLLKTCTIQELQFKDGGGRNALQLACSWGQKYDFLTVEITEAFSILDDKIYKINDDDVSEVRRDTEEYCQILDILTDVCDRTEFDNLHRMTALSYAYNSLCLMTFVKMLRSYKFYFKDFDNADKLCSIIYYCVVLDFPEIFEIVKDIVDIQTTRNYLLSYLAVARNAVGCVKILTERHGYRDMFLTMACRYGFIDIVKYFIDCGNDINVSDNYGRTAIKAACKNGHCNIVKLLIDSGATIDDSLLHVSVKKQYFDIVKLLIGNGVNVNAVDNQGKTALQYANENYNFDIVKYLIVNDADLNVVDDVYGTVMHRYGQLDKCDIVKLLLDNGADPNVLDNSQKTPLHKACTFGNFNLVKFLIDCNAHVNSISGRGQTPLHFAESPKIIQLLIDNQADPTIFDNFGNTPLHLICGSRTLECVKLLKLLVQKGAVVNCQNKAGETPLHKACEVGDFPTVTFLIDSAANVNVPALNGKTPLLCACRGGDLRVVRLLIENGADVNASNEFSETPLHWSCEDGNFDVVKCLLDNGAGVNAETTYGETPLDMAKSDDVVEILEGSGAKKSETLSD